MKYSMIILYLCKYQAKYLKKKIECDSLKEIFISMKNQSLINI